MKFYMNDLRDILQQLGNEEISTSMALEILNEKLSEAEQKAFEAGWAKRMNKKGSELEATFTTWKAGEKHQY